MTNLTKKILAAGSTALFVSLLATSASALDTRVFLNASATTEHAEVESTSSVRSNTFDHSYGDENRNDDNGGRNGGNSSDDATVKARSNGLHLGWFKNFLGSASSTISASSTGDHAQVGFWSMIMNLFNAQGSMNASSTSGNQDLFYAFSTVNVQKVNSSSALVTWSPKVFSNVEVYYATTSPVIVASSTAHVSPTKFWRRSQVALKNLLPNTTYYYKVVAQSSNGTTTSAESSFVTESR